ncbi:MAG TPA: tyrosine-type recombinase/integrase [Ktedonobacteraceae bacterium]|jgi:integrase|nr:tyrosine-type recombinase/integrase [Ktedonobacteraceae bacterium]
MAKEKSRRRGDGSVYKRADGRYSGFITLEDHKRKYFYGKTEREVERKIWVAQRELEQGKLATGPQQTVKQFLEYWLEDVRKPQLRPGSYQLYRCIIHAHLIPALGHLKLQKLTPQHIQKFYAEKQRTGASPNRIRTMHNVLHKALEHARRLGLVGINASAGADLPRVDTPEGKTLTPEQAHRLIAAAKKEWMRTVLIVALATGMREGELLGLHWEDVHLDEGYLDVKWTLSYVATHGFVMGEPKTRSGRRTITLAPFVREVLSKHRVAQEQERVKKGWKEDTGLVFPNTAGGFLSSSTLRARFYSLLKRAGVPAMHFHELRHSAATLLLSMGIPMKTVQAILGHASYAITANIYGHVTREMHEEAAHAMERFLRHDKLSE